MDEQQKLQLGRLRKPATNPRTKRCPRCEGTALTIVRGRLQCGGCGWRSKVDC